MKTTLSEINLSDIKNDVRKNLSLAQKEQENQSLFTVKTANDWIEEAKQNPIPNMLFSEFWFENEVCILFADTNLGKSILAVQIANSISKGSAIKGFKISANAQKVAYLDFELSAKQFEARYSEGFTNHYVFSDNFIRANINPNTDIPKKISFDDYLYASIEKMITDFGLKILIVDNITYLRSDMEKAKDALPLMKNLQKMKNKYDLSILVLAHTPKRDMSKPITINDIQGSKMLINFTDSAFAIGKSYKDSSIRYIKQIKQRNTEELYGYDNVILCQILKESNFLSFDFFDFAEEREHLRINYDNETSELETGIIELAKQKPQMSIRGIAKQLITNHSKVGRVLRKHGIIKTVEQVEQVEQKCSTVPKQKMLDV